MLELDQKYINALNLACQQAREGKKNVTVHNDDEVTISLTSSGSVEVALKGDDPDRDFRTWSDACRELAEDLTSVSATPIAGPFTVTFSAKE